MNDEKQKQIQMGEFFLDLPTQASVGFTLGTEGRPLLVHEGGVIGKFHEREMLQTKLRKHDVLKFDALLCDSEARLPFGSEPTVRRHFEVAGNHANLIVDWTLQSDIVLDALSIDDLFLPGAWRDVTVVTIKEDELVKETIEISENASVLWSGSIPFLACVFRTEDGLLVEIGTGDDLWRWMVADSLGGRGSFRIEKSEDGIRVFREVFRIPETMENIKGRDWRFKWYFAWMKEGDRQRDARRGDDCVELDLSSEKLKSGSYHGCGGMMSSNPCLASAKVEGVLKRRVRSLVAKEEKERLILTNVSPGLCDSASHLRRASKGALLHWDMMKTLDFWFWANRIAADEGKRFLIEPKRDNLFQDFPSLKGLAYETDTDQTSA